MHGKVLILA